MSCYNRLSVCRQKPLRFASVYIPCYGPWIVYIPRFAHWMYTFHRSQPWNVHIQWLACGMYTFHAWPIECVHSTVIYIQCNINILPLHFQKRILDQLDILKQKSHIHYANMEAAWAIQTEVCNLRARLAIFHAISRFWKSTSFAHAKDGNFCPMVNTKRSQVIQRHAVIHVCEWLRHMQIRFVVLTAFLGIIYWILCVKV